MNMDKDMLVDTNMDMDMDMDIDMDLDMVVDMNMDMDTDMDIDIFVFYRTLEQGSDFKLRGKNVFFYYDQDFNIVNHYAIRQLIEASHKLPELSMMKLKLHFRAHPYDGPAFGHLMPQPEFGHLWLWWYTYLFIHNSALAHGTDSE